jgi:hypothetical protein
VKFGSSSKSRVYGEKLKKFPISLLKILPAGLVIGILSGCHTSTASVEASSTRNPVVAPAGTVLRVRLDQTLETGRSRPGDRFSGTLDVPVMSGRTEVLPKGTRVEGHIETARAALALTLDSFELEGQRYALSTNIVSRTGSPQRAGMQLTDVFTDAANGGAVAVMVPADSIIGFTLTSTLTA